MKEKELENARQEWKILQDIVARQEKICYEMRGWMCALLTALVVARVGKDAILSSAKFLAIAVVLNLAFLWAELVQRVPKRRAIDRIGVVEDALRGGREYDGPRIAAELLRKNGSLEPARELVVPRVWAFYLTVLIVAVLVALFAP